MSDETPEYCFRCKGCSTVYESTDSMIEVQEERKDHSHFECAECGSEKFTKGVPYYGGKHEC